MLSQDSLRGAVGAAGITAPARFEATTPSTNADAFALAEDGAPEWTVVAAGHQSRGRGRLGRTWHAPPGRSLLFSILLRPEVPPHAAPLISLLAAERMAATCREDCGVRVECKWPNDLVVRDRKLAGILAETRVAGGSLGALVLGMGLNVRLRPGDFPAEIRDSATSLLIEGAEIEEADLLRGFLVRFREAYAPGDPGFGPRVLDAYRQSSATLGRRVLVTRSTGEKVEGQAVDLDPDGALVLEDGGRSSRVSFGEVGNLGT